MLTLAQATRRANAAAQDVLNAYMHYLRVCAFTSDGMSRGPQEERDEIDSARELFEREQARYREMVDALSDEHPTMKESKKMMQAYRVQRVLYRPHWSKID